MFKWLAWKPFKLYAIDADTGQPIDPNLHMKRYVQYYETTKSNSGKAVIVAKRRPKSGETSKNGEKPKEEEKPKAECPCKEAKEGCPCKDAKDGCLCKKHTDAKVAEKMEEADKKRDGENVKKTDAVETSKVDRSEWTAEQDGMLKRMKKLNNSWKDIGAALQCSVGSCKKRFNEINKEAEPEKQEEGKKGEAKKDWGAGKSKNKQKGNQAEQKPATAAESPTADGVIELTEDDVFSEKELEILLQLYKKDFSQSWLRLASAFYDRTGRRVHPDDIRERFAAIQACSC